MAKTPDRPAPSALSNLISGNQAKSESTSLPLEVLHNLQYQHGWRDLQIYVITNDSRTPELLALEFPSHSLQTPRSHVPPKVYLISGLPPCHGYLHPDFQNNLIRRKISESSVTVQREWVVPMSLGEKWTLQRLSRVFDAMPPRSPLKAEGGVELAEWRDAKRVLLGMLSTSGMGGDGTIVYYIMQEGEVKPRQNG